MDQSGIKVGAEYGYRDQPQRRDALQRVRILEHVRRKWRVEWIDPNPGLTDFVASKNIVVPWKERAAFLRDERRHDELGDYSRARWPGPEHPLSRAVDTVLDATGENVGVVADGILWGQPDAIERIAQRSGREQPDDFYGFKDRMGSQYCSFPAALELAQRFAAAEPATVTLAVDLAQREYEVRAREPGNAFYGELLQRERPALALCREWAGFDSSMADRDAEIERLRRIVGELVWDLKQAGHDDLARKVERKLHGR